ncbi:hypothetical protein [Halocatena halophila]|uniref:hypothetical protein n=1 Tax=Halocatena halophila TaxID=2814576 RepID=UPI002ED2CB4C
MTNALEDVLSAESDETLVRAGDYRVVTAGESLYAYGLGASVAIAICGPDSMGGLAHALLSRPDGSMRRGAGTFVESAIRVMLRELIEAGAGYGSCEAKLAGGATVFQLEGLDPDTGDRTVATARQELSALDVPVVASAIGGQRGRCVAFDTAENVLTVATSDGESTRL